MSTGGKFGQHTGKGFRARSRGGNHHNSEKEPRAVRHAGAQEQGRDSHSDSAEHSEQRKNHANDQRRGRGGNPHRGNQGNHHPRRNGSPRGGFRRHDERAQESASEQITTTDSGEQIFSERTPRVVNAAKLKRSAARKKAKRFLVEGENSVEAAVATGAATDVFVTKSAATRFTDIVDTARAMDAYVHFIDEKAAKSLQDTVTSTGIFAVCREVLWSPRDVLSGKPTLVSVPVETNEPGNAGTLIRVADAMGANAVLFAGDTVDPQSGKAARSSAGSLFHIPVARERNIMKVISMLRASGLAIAATAADGEVDLTEAEKLLSEPTAWLFGNEAHGLPEELQAQADYRVRIPIRGRAESLNLATAASICLFESSKYQALAEQSDDSEVDEPTSEVDDASPDDEVNDED